MSIATSSRRNKQPSSDIEEDNPTQERNSDEVDDADGEVQPRRSAKRVKKEKRTTKKKRQEQKDQEEGPEEDDDDDDDDDRIDIEKFTNQPLGKADEVKLKGMAADWANMRKLISSNSFPMMRDVGMSMAEAAEGDDEEKGFAELDIIIKDLIDIDEEMAAHEKSVDDIRQKLLQGEAIDDVLEHYNAGVKQKVKDYKNKTTRQKYAKSEPYTIFKQGIYEVQHSGEAMPPITNFIPKEDGDDSDDDEDVEIGALAQDYKCPLTLTTLVDPMTSQVCGHSFSAAAIRDYLKGRQKCPGAGCNKIFTMADVKPDKDLAKRVKLALRRVQRQEENSDAEEVVE